MAEAAELWEIRVAPARLDEFLAFAARAAAVRQPFGLCRQLVLKTGASPDEFTMLRVWADEASIRRWRASAVREQQLEEASYLRVGEPRRVSRVVAAWPGPLGVADTVTSS